MKQQLVAEIAKYLGNTTDDAKLWNNLLKVKVYYEDFNYENIEETPSYSVRCKIATFKQETSLLSELHYQLIQPLQF